MNKLLTIARRGKGPLSVCVVFLSIFAFLHSTKPEPQAKTPRIARALAYTIEAAESETPIVIEAFGTIEATHSVELGPLVSGPVVWISPKLHESGFFRINEPLFHIEKRDYTTELKKTESDLARAAKDLEIAKANARIAAEEWELMRDISSPDSQNSENAGELALYKPQLASAVAAYEAAKAGRDQALTDLQRTIVRAPYDSFVETKSVGVGQLLAAGEKVITLIGTVSVDISVAISMKEAYWIRQGLEGQPSGTLTAEVGMPSDPSGQTWSGSIERLSATVDPETRTHRVVVRVKNPFELDPQSNSVRSGSLSVGGFARVRFEPTRLTGVVSVPRSAIHEDSTVWIANNENLLEIRPVAIAYASNNHSHIHEGVEPGERIVISSLRTAVQGMPLLPVDSPTNNLEASAEQSSPSAYVPETSAPAENEAGDYHERAAEVVAADAPPERVASKALPERPDSQEQTGLSPPPRVVVEPKNSEGRHGWYAQVASLRTRKKALALAQKVEKLGFTTHLQKTEVRNKLFHRVLIGPFTGSEQVRDAVTELKKSNLAGRDYVLRQLP